MRNCSRKKCGFPCKEQRKQEPRRTGGNQTEHEQRQGDVPKHRSEHTSDAVCIAAAEWFHEYLRKTKNFMKRYGNRLENMI